jgi:hypothetical protein
MQAVFAIMRKPHVTPDVDIVGAAQRRSARLRRDGTDATRAHDFVIRLTPESGALCARR